MPEIQSIKLSQLTAEVHKALNTAFTNKFFWVVAEITNYSYYSQKGHHYFDLVEKSETGNDIIAKMQTAAWSAGNTSIREFERLTGQKFKNDIQILTRVSVDYHSSYGLKLTLHDVDVNFTIGALEKQRQETLQRLLSECSDFIRKVGDKYVTRNNQLKFPTVIQKIAVVTSKTSAGYQDFSHTLEANSFGYKFFIDNYFTVVQGESNAQVVFNKLLEVHSSGKPYDAVVIIRGGGSQTDFLIFDQFILGKIVAKFPIPIITGIGHQKNETIVDLMANTSTKTPTKSAEYIIAHNRLFEEKVLTAQKTVIIKSQQIFSKNSQLLLTLNSLVVNKSRNLLAWHKDQLVRCNQIAINKTREILYHKRSSLVNLASQLSTRPKIIVSNKLNDIRNMIANLKYFSPQLLKNQKSYLNHFVSIANTMAPTNLLKKGFAIVKVNNTVTSDPEEIAIGKDISVILSNKEIKSTVKSKSDYNGTDFNL